MIRSREDLRYYIEQDKKARKPYIENKWKRHLLADMDCCIFKYLKYLRKQEFYLNCRRSFLDIVFYYWYGRLKNQLGKKLSFDIPTNVFEEGLAISHHGTLIINAGAKVGKNCILHGNNCIGNNGISQGAPVLGDNVDIGVGAVIIGDIFIASGSKIGANALVNKSFYEENSVIVGVPAHKVN